MLFSLINPDMERLMLGSFLLFFLKQLVDFGHELAYILELQVDRGKSKVGNLVYPSQFGKKNFSDVNGIQLAFRAFLDGLFHFVDDLLELRQADRPFFARLQKPIQYFVPCRTFPCRRPFSPPCTVFHRCVHSW